MSAVPASSAAVQPIPTGPSRRAGRHTLARVTLAAGLVVAGVGVLATSASANAGATPAAESPAPQPNVTEPGEGTVVTIIPPAVTEPADTVPPAVVRSEMIVRDDPVGIPAELVSLQARPQVNAPRVQATPAAVKALPRLPETGSATAPLVLAGAGLVGLGVVALAFGRRTQAA